LNNQEEEGDARNTSNNAKNNLKHNGELHNINNIRNSLSIQGYKHPRDIIIPSILVRVGEETDDKRPHKNSYVE